MSVFPQSPPASGWLSSLLRPGYSVALWDARAEEIPKDRLGVAPFEMITLLTFHAEMRRMVGRVRGLELDLGAKPYDKLVKVDLAP